MSRSGTVESDTTRLVSRRNLFLLSLASAGGVLGKRLVGTPGSPFARETGDRGPAPATRPIPVRAEPVRISPYPDMADLVPMDALGELARRAIPSWYSLKTSWVMHAFRLWGSDATVPIEVFSRPFVDMVFSGAELQRYLLDDGYYSTVSPGEPPLLIQAATGVEVRTFSTGRQGSFAGQLGHPDDLLCACAEVGLKADHKVNMRHSDASIRDLVDHAAWRFDLAKELEWTIEALARYLPPCDHWTNAEGVDFTFQDAVDALLDKPIGQGACLGTHVPNALVCLVRIAETEGILRTESIRAVKSRLSEFSLSLALHADEKGAWTAGSTPDTRKIAQTPDAALEEKLVATGHHLEWIAIAPPECRPKRKQIKAAIEAIMELALNLPPYAVSRLYLPFSHLVRALCLIKNTPATAASRNGRTIPRETPPNSARVESARESDFLVLGREPASGTGGPIRARYPFRLSHGMEC